MVPSNFVPAGQKSGSEAAVHAMHAIFEADETDGILLIDAANAFNSLNRAAALHNIRILCPTISVFAINTYRIPARLFITGGKEILSAEGTTQGDPLSMGVYICLKYTGPNNTNTDNFKHKAMLVY